MYEVKFELIKYVLMKIESRIIEILLVLFVLLSCNTSNNTSIKELSINNSFDDSNITLSKIASSSEIIPLETNDSILIGEIKKILCENNYIYISDGRTLFKFNDKGYFISKINKIGTGPDEYTSITDFQICSNDKVWILSRKDKRLCNYSWQATIAPTRRIRGTGECCPKNILSAKLR